MRSRSNARDAFRRIDLHFHDLRHECASRSYERGVPLLLIQRWLGHAAITTTMRYLNVADASDATLQAKWFSESAVPDMSRQLKEGEPRRHSTTSPTRFSGLNRTTRKRRRSSCIRERGQRFVR